MGQPYPGSTRRSSALAAALSLMRVGNSLLMGIAVVASEWVALRGVPPPLLQFAGFLVAFCLTSSIMVLNDYFDREIDLVNRPGRPIPSGAVKPKEALGLAASLMVVGLAASLVSELWSWSFLLAAFSAVISVGYDARLKKSGLPGNAVVSFNVALPFVYGAVMVGRLWSPINVLFFFYAFVANMAREIFKGIPDVEGDKRKGAMTLAVRRGPRFAARLGFVLVAADVLASPIPYVLGFARLPYLVTLLVGDAVLLHSSLVMALHPEAKVVDRHKLEMLLGMAIIILAFLISPF